MGIATQHSLHNEKYTDVGAARATSVHWLLSSCDQVVQSAVRKLKSQASLLGGDLVYGVKFYGYNPQDVYSSPSCWTTVSPLLALLPFGIVVEVSGRAAKTETSWTSSSLPH